MDFSSGGADLEFGSGVIINTGYARGVVDAAGACIGHYYCVQWNAGGGRCASLILWRLLGF